MFRGYPLWGVGRGLSALPRQILQIRLEYRQVQAGLDQEIERVDFLQGLFY